MHLYIPSALLKPFRLFACVLIHYSDVYSPSRAHQRFRTGLLSTYRTLNRDMIQSTLLPWEPKETGHHSSFSPSCSFTACILTSNPTERDWRSVLMCIGSNIAIYRPYKALKRQNTTVGCVWVRCHSPSCPSV